jgi:hypothetical protein
MPNQRLHRDLGQKAALTREPERYENVMIAKFFKYYLEIIFLFYAYVIGYFYMAVPYVLGFIIPSLKKVLRNYELAGDYRSISIISLISGTIWYFTMVGALFNDPAWDFSIIELAFWYMGYYFWGFFALYLLADYKKKKHFFS